MIQVVLICYPLSDYDGNNNNTVICGIGGSSGGESESAPLWLCSRCNAQLTYLQSRCISHQCRTPVVIKAIPLSHASLPRGCTWGIKTAASGSEHWETRPSRSTGRSELSLLIISLLQKYVMLPEIFEYDRERFLSQFSVLCHRI